MKNKKTTRNKQVILVCKFCNKSFTKPYGKRNRIFCGVECQHKARKGVRRPFMSEITKRRMANMSIEERALHSLKISKAKKGIPNLKQRGENNHLWKGGRMSRYSLTTQIRKSKEYILWRTHCFQRDNYTCQGCGKRKCILNVDHIIPFSFILQMKNIASFKDAVNCYDLWDIRNGRTLCEHCHKLTPTYGNKIFNYKNEKRETAGVV